MMWINFFLILPQCTVNQDISISSSLFHDNRQRWWLDMMVRCDGQKWRTYIKDVTDRHDMMDRHDMTDRRDGEMWGTDVMDGCDGQMWGTDMMWKTDMMDGCDERSWWTEVTDGQTWRRNAMWTWQMDVMYRRNGRMWQRSLCYVCMYTI